MRIRWTEGADGNLDQVSQTGYVRDFLRFLGIDDVEFVYAEGLAMGDASKSESLARAGQVVKSLVEREAVALAA